MRDEKDCPVRVLKGTYPEGLRDMLFVECHLGSAELHC